VRCPTSRLCHIRLCCLCPDSVVLLPDSVTSAILCGCYQPTGSIRSPLHLVCRTHDRPPPRPPYTPDKCEHARRMCVRERACGACAMRRTRPCRSGRRRRRPAPKPARSGVRWRSNGPNSPFDHCRVNISVTDHNSVKIY
jgi:hypothetical protein